MPFPQGEVSRLLAECHRRCCICHRFCGVKIETDHIVPLGDGGPDDIDNAIPVCFECHAEIHLYNDRHPRGRKFRPEELRQHREQWLEICRTSAQFLASVPPTTDVGPVQALIDELQFNQVVAARHEGGQLGAPLEVAQFNRCIEEGATALMADDVKRAIFGAYAAIKRANAFVVAMPSFEMNRDPWAEAMNRASRALREASDPITAALDALNQHLGREQ